MYIVYTLFCCFRSLQSSVMLSYPSTEFVGAKLCRSVYIQENLSVHIQINIFDCKIDFCSLNLCVCVCMSVSVCLLNHHFSTKLSSYACKMPFPHSTYNIVLTELWHKCNSTVSTVKFDRTDMVILLLL